MKAILTVLGQDQVGIVAKVSTKLATLDVNILDISQTLMQDNFTMMMMVEWDETVQFETINQSLNDLRTETGMDIRNQRQEIIDAKDSTK